MGIDETKSKASRVIDTSVFFFNGQESSSADVKAVVPHGSILCPFFYYLH